jgi:hypothetical protein
MGYRRFLATPDDDHFVIDCAKARRTPSSTESSCSHEHRSLLAAAFAGGNVVLGNLRARDYQMSKGVVLEV